MDADTSTYVIESIICGQMTPEQLAECVVPIDQTIGCILCDEAWWGDNYTADHTLFHAPDCPLFGRRDVALAMTDETNLAFIEKELGHPVGLSYPATTEQPTIAFTIF